MYVYKVKCDPTGEFYFGARFSIFPDNKFSFKTDFWKSYFTSSKLILERINTYGFDAFSYECLWEGDDLDLCLETERQLIMANQGNLLMLNQGFQNFTKETVERGRITSICTNAKLAISKFYWRNRKSIEFLNETKLNCLLRKIDFIEANGEKTYKRVRQFLMSIPTFSSKLPRVSIHRNNILMRVNENYLDFFLSIGFEHGIDEQTSHKISLANQKSGKKLIYKDSIEKWCNETELANHLKEGWQLGRRPEIRKIIQETSTGRLHSEETKRKMQAYARQKVYYTSPCLTKLRAFMPGDTIPDGWIKGNKLKTRNQKISESLYEQHRIKKESGEKRANWKKDCV